MRAAARVHRFLSSAREIIAEKGSTEFGVQEVCDHSKQSLRSFYKYFAGKHELLLALFEDEVHATVTSLHAAAVEGDPLDRLQAAVVALCRQTTMREGGTVQPLFFEFAQRLMIDHADEVAACIAPLVDYFLSIVEDAASAGLLRPGRQRRQATIVIQVATATAQRVRAGSAGPTRPITCDEVWDFCLHAITPDDIVETRNGITAGVQDGTPSPSAVGCVC
jgi:AcrR family transcriptional regulator